MKPDPRPQDHPAEHFRLSREQKQGLEKRGLQSLRDLLYHFPTRYGDTAKVTTIDQLTAGKPVQLYGRIIAAETKRSFHDRTPMAEATIDDGTGEVTAVWFHQPYMAKIAKEGSRVRLTGTANQQKNGRLGFINPDLETVSRIPIGVGESLFSEDTEAYAQPIYPESRGLTSRWLSYRIRQLLGSGLLEHLPDPIPEPIRRQYHLPDLATALIWIHAPKKQAHAATARKRFAFEEIFFIQLEKQKERRAAERRPSFRIDRPVEEIQEFTRGFPFAPTSAQNRAVETILEDFRRGRAMSRLLEGDVGSGKTFVAAVAAYAAVTTRPKPDQDFGHLQVALMAPTGVLARQHFESFQDIFAQTGLAVGLLTASECRKFPSKTDPQSSTRISRKKLLEWVAGGEIPILIGTHSLIQRSVSFENLAFVVVDEQHRFGTFQRAKLRQQDEVLPHLLSMTATPIPRTLALTMYGDLDLTVLDELPAGRKFPETRIVPPNKREEVYEFIDSELAEGRQLFVICPRIDAPDPEQELAVQAKAVKDEAKRLQKQVFPRRRIGVMHSQLKPREKNQVMEEFAAGNIDILVSTSVVEVGVNVPNATMMIIEGAERFGLAQQHQFRGRIMRSSHQPYCFVFTDSASRKTRERLRALSKAKSGFELAEYDLAQRGAGELAGRRQSGISDLGMEAIRNLKMVEAARTEAAKLLETDEGLNSFPVLRQHLTQTREIHFE